MGEDNMRSQRGFETVCSLLDERNMRYKKDEEKLAVFFTTASDDIPVEVFAHFVQEAELFVLFSKLPFDVPVEKSFDAAAAVTYINNLLVDGNFDYDISDGVISFRITNMYADTDLSKDAIDYMIVCLIKTVDKYNDKLLALVRGLIDFKQFIALIKGEKK